MTTEYHGNTNKEKEKAEKRPEKNVQKIVEGEVIVQKKPVGRKFKDLVIAADFGSVIRFIGYEVLIPAFKHLIVDSTSRGIDRMVYGEAQRPRGYPGQSLGGSRMTYQNYQSPVLSRPYPGDPRSRMAPSPEVGPRRSSSSHSRDDIVLVNREDAEGVIEQMNNIVDQYEVASVADLNDLLGVPTSYVDNKWGWTDFRGATLRQIRQGYLVELPPVEPIV